jgi:choline dehydrogenase-like flavoprotein
VASRYNLVILTEAFVEELRIGQVGGEWIAQGARFCHSGAEHYAEATKEVIVCAGSVQSPQLLEISGIGNADILANAGINVKFSNPNVGENLQDHMSEFLFTALVSS